MDSSGSGNVAAIHAKESCKKRQKTFENRQPQLCVGKKQRNNYTALIKLHPVECRGVGKIDTVQIKYKIGFWTLALIVAFVSLVFIPRGETLKVNNGENVTIARSSIGSEIFGDAAAAISYRWKNSAKVDVVLWQDFFDGPVTIYASTNSNIAFCLYDYDVELKLIRIDSSQPFVPMGSASSISRIVFTGSCLIQEATGDDWQEFVTYLRDVKSRKPPYSSLHVSARSYSHPEAVLRMLEYQHIK